MICTYTREGHLHSSLLIGSQLSIHPNWLEHYFVWIQATSAHSRALPLPHVRQPAQGSPMNASGQEVKGGEGDDSAEEVLLSTPPRPLSAEAARLL